MFAIQWAPFGGADSGELLVRFGVTKRRFLQVLNAALTPRRTDNSDVRGLKRHLLATLDHAWNPSRGSGSFPCSADIDGIS